LSSGNISVMVSKLGFNFYSYWESWISSGGNKNTTLGLNWLTISSFIIEISISGLKNPSLSHSYSDPGVSKHLRHCNNFSLLYWN